MQRARSCPKRADQRGGGKKAECMSLSIRWNFYHLLIKDTVVSDPVKKLVVQSIWHGCWRKLMQRDALKVFMDSLSCPEIFNIWRCGHSDARWHAARRERELQLKNFCFNERVWNSSTYLHKTIHMAESAHMQTRSHQCVWWAGRVLLKVIAR